MPESLFLKRVREAQRARGIAVTPLTEAEKEPTWQQALGKATVALLLLFVAGFLAGLAYNQLRPLFHGPALTYWQAVAATWVLFKVRQFLKS